ncbi:ATPase [Haloprofundus salinisoli]|uniref:ATPase n=1 Tax=Haloprofundus salinisoli TaxID=2876193 RepID=UPI001CCB83FD|nr:ATPase [Haloprofundus salinisoli]
MRLLVAGGDRVDAGKTTFSVGLLASLRRDGYAPVGFKPRAGNDYWFDHDDVRASGDAGRLYGKDAQKLAAASAGDVEPETINPVHRLWRPTPGKTGLLGESGRTFLVDRVTGEAGPEFVVNADAEAEGLLPDEVLDSLPLDDARRVDSLSGFNEVMRERYVPAAERLARRVAATETSVVESYADIAVPLSDAPFDAVAVVEPGRARIYDGARYLKAREAASGGPREGQLEEYVDSVVGMLEPLSTVGLRALGNEARGNPERVADAHAEAYDALVEAAER